MISVESRQSADFVTFLLFAFQSGALITTKARRAQLAWAAFNGGDALIASFGRRWARRFHGNRPTKEAAVCL